MIEFIDFDKLPFRAALGLKHQILLEEQIMFGSPSAEEDAIRKKSIKYLYDNWERAASLQFLFGVPYYLCIEPSDNEGRFTGYELQLRTF